MATSAQQSDGNGTSTRLDLISFPSLALSYLQFAVTDRRQPPVNGVVYTNEYTISPITSAATPASGMPRTGSATYNGLGYGLAFVPGVTLRTTSSVQVVANFASARVNGTLNNFNFYDYNNGAAVAAPPGGSGLVFTFDGVIQNNTFTTQAQSGTSNLGPVDGLFAGPSAQEVGGAYHAVIGDLTIFGAFAAKQ